MNGVYRLYFTKDTRCYIGSSLNLNSRLRTHILELLNKHTFKYIITKSF